MVAALVARGGLVWPWSWLAFTVIPLGRAARCEPADVARSLATAPSIDPTTGFGTLMQDFDAAQWRGKRLRLSAWVKSADVKPGSGVWMRIDIDKTSAAFDNMVNRAIRGTTEWTKYEVVLDVAEQATGIYLGLILDGKGTTTAIALAAEPEAPRTFGLHVFAPDTSSLFD